MTNCVLRRVAFAVVLMLALIMLAGFATAQTDCATGDNPLDSNPPKDIKPEEVIQKFGAMEAKVKQAREQYTFTQDLMVQTLDDKNSVDGQFHQVTTISYDKGKRVESVTYSEQPTLRSISLSSEDWDDIKTFMPIILTTQDLAEYKLTYAGQQHVDDLDTYVFHLEPIKEEKNKRYFEGRVWVDSHDFEVVKTCGKSVPDQIHAKKGKPQEVRPTFVSYRQWVDKAYWFPAYARVDDTLHFKAESVHIKEVVRFTGYKKNEGMKAQR